MKLGYSKSGKCSYSMANNCLWRKLSWLHFPQQIVLHRVCLVTWWVSPQILFICWLGHLIQTVLRQKSQSNKQLCKFRMARESIVRLMALKWHMWCEHAPHLFKHNTEQLRFCIDFPAQIVSEYYKRILCLLQSELHKEIINEIILIRLC